MAGMLAALKKSLTMSSDMLGDLIRILVTVPTGMLAVVYDLMQKLTGADGASWFATLKRFLRKENPWPSWPVVVSRAPPEVGPALREQYQDQPLGEWCKLVMEPLVDSHRGLHVFCVVRDDVGLWLNAHYGHSDCVSLADDRWVFVL